MKSILKILLVLSIIFASSIADPSPRRGYGRGYNRGYYGNFYPYYRRPVVVVSPLISFFPSYYNPYYY